MELLSSFTFNLKLRRYNKLSRFRRERQNSVDEAVDGVHTTRPRCGGAF
jgi:sigma54-dependent transcription regulator